MQSPLWEKVGGTPAHLICPFIFQVTQQNTKGLPEIPPQDSRQSGAPNT